MLRPAWLRRGHRRLGKCRSPAPTASYQREFFGRWYAFSCTGAWRKTRLLGSPVVRRAAFAASHEAAAVPFGIRRRRKPPVCLAAGGRRAASRPGTRGRSVPLGITAMRGAAAGSRTRHERPRCARPRPGAGPGAARPRPAALRRAAPLVVASISSRAAPPGRVSSKAAATFRRLAPVREGAQARSGRMPPSAPVEGVPRMRLAAAAFADQKP